jgi:diguanylate cyclase (GGDEF)-like protein
MRELSVSRELRRSLAIGGLALIVVIVGMWGLLHHFENQQTEVAAEATAKAVAEQVAIQRKVYSKLVVPRARHAGMEIEASFENRDNTLPLPASLVNAIGASLAEQFPGSRVRLFSRFPFVTNQRTTLDGFELDALAAVEARPEEAFWDIAQFNGKEVVRYAVADVMERECVDCHNAHPNSQRRDWKVGDVRGAIEVMIPIDELSARIRSVQVSFGLIVMAIAIALIGIALFIRYDYTRVRRERVALTDPTTSLPTRRAVTARISDEITRARRLRIPIAIVLFDIDHFKSINDEYGHAVGDRVLAEVGQTLFKGVRRRDIAARWGGEEFLVVLPTVGVDAAKEVAERIRKDIAGLVLLGMRVTVSAGVAEVLADETPEQAIARADTKLYEAKHGGRDLVRG